MPDPSPRQGPVPTQHRQDRRRFLHGALTVGLLSPLTGTLVEQLGSPAGSTVRIAVSNDQTGMVRLMLAAAGLDTTRVEVVGVGGDPQSQLQAMVEATGTDPVVSDTYDVVCVDPVHAARFAADHKVRRIERKPPVFLSRMLEACSVDQDADEDAGRHFWPFIANVGILVTNRDSTWRETDRTSLDELLRGTAPQGWDRWSAALSAPGDSEREEVLCALLEHAVALHPQIVGADGTLDPQAEAWNDVLDLIRTSRDQQRLRATNDADTAVREFANRIAPDHMRAWSCRYPDLKRRARMRAPRADMLRPSGDQRGGVLGGMCLGVSSGARDPEAAFAVVAHLTGATAQALAAMHGFAPSRRSTYDDQDVTKLFPDLKIVKDAVQESILRPKGKGYDAFSTQFMDLMGTCLADDRARLTDADLAGPIAALTQ